MYAAVLAVVVEEDHLIQIVGHFVIDDLLYQLCNLSRPNGRIDGFSPDNIPFLEDASHIK